MSRSNRLPRVDILTLLLVGTVLGVGLWLYSNVRAITAPSPEAEFLRAEYGPDRSSQHAEEWIVRDFFDDRRNGFFLDVGANHYKTHSNTYYLETALGWQGIAVEPLVEFAADYARYRPNTRFRAFFVSDVSNEQAKLYVQQGEPRVSSARQDFTEFYGENVSAIDVATIALNDLLEAERVERVDFLSMDIELWEPKALAGFDVERFRPELVCIEAHLDVRQQILDYFARHGYVVVGRYLRADIWNLYFTPIGAPDPSGS
jgi:FkbM family methyltransferase